MRQDLIPDYRSTVALYQACQNYFRARQPPLLAVWEKTMRRFYRPAPKPISAVFPMLMSSLMPVIFALKTRATEIAEAMREFFGEHFGDG